MEGAPVRYDLGRMLKEHPRYYRITQLYIAKMGHLRLTLQATVAFFCQSVFDQSVGIDCINAVDYAIRPANPWLGGGGPCIEYLENHEALQNYSQTVPNTGGRKTFDPPVKFTMLSIDQSYVIAERFELTILSDGSRVAGWSPAEKKFQLERLRQGLDSIDKYRL